MSSVKVLAKQAQKFLTEKGYTSRGDKAYPPKLSDMYELFALLAGFKTHNVAKSNQDYEDIILKTLKYENISDVGKEFLDLYKKHKGNVAELRIYYSTTSEEIKKILKLTESMDIEVAYVLTTDLVITLGQDGHGGIILYLNTYLPNSKHYDESKSLRENIEDFLKSEECSEEINENLIKFDYKHIMSQIVNFS